MSILVDEKHPIRCASKLITKPVLELHSKSLLSSSGSSSTPAVGSKAEYFTESFCASDWSDFQGLNCTVGNQSCILLRAVVLALGVVDLCGIK